MLGTAAPARVPLPRKTLAVPVPDTLALTLTRHALTNTSKRAQSPQSQ